MINSANDNSIKHKHTLADSAVIYLEIYLDVKV